jgi:proteasome inhibitor subunit 1 (PI31)
MPDPTLPKALVALVPHLLPATGDASLDTPTDLIAALVHAIQISLGFRLANTPSQQNSDDKGPPRQTEDDRVPESRPRNNDDDTFSETETAVNDDEQVQPPSEGLAVSRSIIDAAKLLPGWNSRGEDSYTFEYKHEQSGLKFIIRVGRMGGRVNVSGMAEVSISRRCG